MPLNNSKLSLIALSLLLLACNVDRPSIEPGKWECRDNYCEITIRYAGANLETTRRDGLLVFMETDYKSDVWHNLPHVEFFDGYQEVYTFSYERQRVHLRKTRTDGQLPQAPALRRYRLVYADNNSWAGNWKEAEQWTGPELDKLTQDALQTEELLLWD